MLLSFSGGYIGGVPPVPIPNTEVKPSRADGTPRETARESRSLPDLFDVTTAGVPFWDTGRWRLSGLCHVADDVGHHGDGCDRPTVLRDDIRWLAWAHPSSDPATEGHSKSKAATGC